MNAMSPPPPDDGDDDDRRGSFLVGLAVVLVIVAIGFLIVWKMRQNEKMQECLLTGRRDCAATNLPDSR
jgi:hypothetical protein